MRVAAASDRSQERLEGLHGRALEKIRAFRASQVELGRILLELRRSGSFYRFGATTFPIYCDRIGLSGQEGRELTAIAEAAESRPEVEAKVAEGTLSVQKAAAVAEVLRNPVLQRPGEDWLLKAETHSSRELRDLLRERKEELALEEPPVSLTLFVSRRARDAFGRCRELVSRSAGEFVTEGRAFGVVCEDYLVRHDPERKAARLAEKDREARDNGSPAGGGFEMPRSRHVPAAEQREVLRRQGDRCAVEGCDAPVFLQNAHVRPFALGGANRHDNLHRYCWEHHRQHDRGDWKTVERRDGRIVMIDRRGVVVGRLREAVDAAATGSERPPP